VKLQYTLVIATRNDHKVGEIRAILGEQFRYLMLRDFPDAPPVIEDAETFEGNAAKKALELAQWLIRTQIVEGAVQNGFVLADDSGLEVDALDCKPGVHSARFAALDSGKPRNSADAENNAKLIRLLTDVPAEQRTARFRCVIALVGYHPSSTHFQPQFFSGTCEGRIDVSPHGKGGFGYDPLFIPDGFDVSFAELGEDVKNRLSHRANALAKLQEFFQNKL
jgi:XTP/dITP diphosphohydrolase